MKAQPTLLLLNQMAGPLTWELAEDLGAARGPVALLTGHPDTLVKQSDNVQLFAAAAYQRGTFARRALSWLHYWLQAFVWLWRWPSDVSLLLFSNPPLLVWLGWLMRALRGTRYSVMVHDIYPDVLVQMGGFDARHLLVRAWLWLNRRAYERAEVVMTLGEYMAATLARQFDATQTAAGRIEVVYPWVDTELIRPLAKQENWFARRHDQLDKLTVMYSGNMGLGHDIETMLSAARRLGDEPGIHFMFIGAGPKWDLVEETLQREHLPNVTLLGWQPEEALPYSLATADVAFVSLEEGMAGLAIPSKAFSSLAAGTPLVVIASEDCELADLVNRHECGWLIAPGDTTALVALLRDLQENPTAVGAIKQRCRQTAERMGSRRNSRQVHDALNQAPAVNFEHA